MRASKVDRQCTLSGEEGRQGSNLAVEHRRSRDTMTSVAKFTVQAAAVSDTRRVVAVVVVVEVAVVSEANLGSQ